MEGMNYGEERGWRKEALSRYSEEDKESVDLGEGVEEAQNAMLK